MRKYLILPVLLISAAGIFAESAISVSPARWDEAEAKADALLAQMTDEEKAGQMIQAERRYMKISDITKYCLGSVLSGGGSVPGKNTVDDWRSMIEEMQAAAAQTRLAVPIRSRTQQLSRRGHLSPQQRVGRLGKYAGNL